jgi:hypothetical protein
VGSQKRGNHLPRLLQQCWIVEFSGTKGIIESQHLQHAITFQIADGLHEDIPHRIKVVF